jgi:hypothetical protein
VETAIAPSEERQLVLSELEASLDTVAGAVHTRWRLDVTTGTAEINVTTPTPAHIVVPCVPHDGATVIVEARSQQLVWPPHAPVDMDDTGRPLPSGVRRAAWEMFGGVRIEVDAGSYCFRRQRDQTSEVQKHTRRRID